MSASSPAVDLKVEKVGSVTVVRFGLPLILSGEKTEKVGQELFRLVASSDPCWLLLDFGKVEMMTSTMIGKLMMLDKKLKTAGGRLALCNLTDSMQAIFDVARLPQVLNVYKEEAEALQSF